MNYSRTYAGSIALFLSFIAQVTGVKLPFTDTDIESVVVFFVGLMGFVTAIWARFSRGDVTAIGTKK